MTIDIKRLVKPFEMLDANLHDKINNRFDMEKKISLITVLETLLLLLFLNSVNAKEQRGYIFTSPRKVKSESFNVMNIRRFGELSPGTLKVQVYYIKEYERDEILTAEGNFDIPEGEASTNLNLYIGKIENLPYSGRIKINGNFGNYVINGSDKISFSDKKDYIVIVQTDKPIYKTGQTVLFRIVKVNRDLKPSGENDEVDIWVEDSKSTRLFQWNNVSIGNGIKQFEFPLSDEPVLGLWKISVSVNKSITSTNFEVKEYVLPKYEVTITIPPFVLYNAEEIPITVCAKYTYGKPVRGILHLNISYEKPTVILTISRIPVFKSFVLEHTEKIDGCVDYTINISRIEIDSHNRRNKLQVVASVEEEGTGATRNETKLIPWKYSALKLNLNQDGTMQIYFKPGLPFNGKLRVSNPDDTSASKEPIRICSTVYKERNSATFLENRPEKFCKNYTSDDNGIIKYVIPPQNKCSDSISIEANSLRNWKVVNNNGLHYNLQQPYTSIKLSPWFSKSGSFIQLQSIQEVLNCGSKISIPVLFTAHTSGVYKIYHQVSKQSQVLKTGFIQHNFSVDNDISSGFQNDIRLVNVETSAKSSSSISSSESANVTNDMPLIGEATIEMNVDASLSPSFHLLVYYIREDGEIVSDSMKFKVEKCFKNKVVFKFGDKVKQPGMITSLHLKASPNSLCGIKVIDKSVSLLDSSDQLTKEGVFRKLSSLDSGIYDSPNRCRRAIRRSGLHLAQSRRSSLRRRFREPSFYSVHLDSLSAWDDSGLLAISDLTLLSRPCKSYGYDRSPVYVVQGLDNRFLNRRMRPFTAQSAVTNIKSKVTKSADKIRNYFPETWLFKMELTNSEGEFVTKERLPHTITEWVGNAVCINPQDGLGISDSMSIKGFQAFFISFTLPYSVIRSETFEIVVSIFNYVSDSLPITVSLNTSDSFQVVEGFETKDVCIAPGTSENLRIKLKATKLGTSNITVHAQTAKKNDACGTENVYNAIARDAMTYPIIVEAEGFPVEEVNSALFCADDGNATNSIKLELPKDLVEDSHRAYIDVSGNILGPSLNNLEHLVRLPTGCGEQNMVKFVPNVLLYDLLSKTRMLTSDLKLRLIRNMNTGAQRQLRYRHPDGSYSAFGENDKEGSMFLTAFVLRYFKLAQEFITIDNNTIVQMQNWIVSKQGSDGCFPDVGKIVDTGVQGGVDEETSKGAITAYVLASLVISGYADSTVKDAALSCISKDEIKDSQPYVTFLYAYAEALSGDAEAAKKRIEDIKPTANTTGGMKYYPNKNASKSRDIETAAYALLAMFESGSTDNILPTVQYLTHNINPYGGFSSTQDTCLGLQALAEFAKPTMKDPIDMILKITGGLEKEISITEDDKLVVKRNVISQVPSQLQLQGTGIGCILYQTVLRYNKNISPAGKAFDFKVAGKCVDDECKWGQIKVDVSYIPKDKRTGMALIEIKMVSGVTPVKESIEKLKEDENLKLKRSEFENNVMVFYFNEISNEEKNFTFDVEELIRVPDRLPAIAKVYDYYNTEKRAEILYKLERCKDGSCLKF